MMWFDYLNRENSDSIKWAIAKKKNTTTPNYVFSIADSDYETAPDIKNALIERAKHGAFGYVYQGDDFVQIIQNWYMRRYGCLLDDHSIVSAPSVINAIAVSLLSLTKPHEGIIIQSPVYHMFKQVIEENGRKVITNPLYLNQLTYQMNFKQLEELFKQGYRTMLLCHPHNPVGRVWTKMELVTLLKLIKRYHVLLISDEIHGDLIMPGHKFYSTAHFIDIYDHVIIVSAPTKSFNLAGLDIAHLIIPNENNRKRIKDTYQRLHLIHPNIFGLKAMKTAYQVGDEWLDAQNKHIYQNYLFLKAFCDQRKTLRLYPLEGTYLAWIEVIDECISVKDLIDRCSQRGVFFSPGSTFGNSDSFIRVSLACSKDQLKKGLYVFTQCLDTFKKL